MDNAEKLLAALGQTHIAHVVVTSAQEGTANASDLTTAEALANSLKTKYNAVQVDVAATAAKLNALIDELETAGILAAS